MVKIWKSQKDMDMNDYQEVEKTICLIIQLLEKENISLNVSMLAIKEILCRLIASMGTPEVRSEILTNFNERVKELSGKK